MKIKKYIEYINQLLIISIISFILYIILWLITDLDNVLESYRTPGDVLREYFYCLILSTCILLVCHVITSIHYFRKYSIERISFLTCIIFTLNLGVAQTTEYLWNLGHNVSRVNSLLDAYFLSIIAILVSAIFISRYYCIIMKQKNDSNNQLRRLLLKRQLDPHFMFNSLNTLAELIHEDSSKAETFAIRLSDIYRYITASFHEDYVTICDAVKITQGYSKIMDIRYPGNFNIHFDHRLFESTDKILPMSLQQLFENATKHNRHSISHPLDIWFILENGYVVVRNNLVPIPENGIPSTGIGLENLKERYRLFCGRPVIIQKDDEFFTVKLPIIKEYEDFDN